MVKVKAHTRKVQRRTNRAKNTKGKSYKYVKVKGHTRNTD